MGRGRQKAKQTKVARQLKYFSPDTDYNALQRELAGPNGHGDNALADPDVDEAEDDEVDEDEDDEVDEDDDVDQYANWSRDPKP